MKLSLNTLGELSITSDGQQKNLPASKRTRALLAYLALTGRPHRRDHLCEFIWTLPDDPRGALRWSLSKLRPLVNSPDTERLLGEGERVWLQTDDIEIDVHRLEQQLNNPEVGVDELKSMDEQLQQPFLGRLDLADQDMFQNWLTSERQKIAEMRIKVRSLLANHPNLSSREQLHWTREWEKLDPHNSIATTRRIMLAESLGRQRVRGVVNGRAAMRRLEEVVFAATADESQPGEAAYDTKPASKDLLDLQTVRFCSSSEGVRLAYTAIGDGAPIVSAAHWLSHLARDWDAPTWSWLYRELARSHRLVRYDQRGCGLSDWNVGELSLDRQVADLEAVVAAAGLDQFDLLGISQGAAVSIAYAVKHPERVKHLVLFGSYARGWSFGSEQQQEEGETLISLSRMGWDGEEQPFWRLLYSRLAPDTTADERNWMGRLCSRAASQANLEKILHLAGQVDIQDLLAKVRVPTLVMHSLGDRTISVCDGCDVAEAIAEARFLGLDSNNHALLGREPASQDFVSALRSFIAR